MRRRGGVGAWGRGGSILLLCEMTSYLLAFCEVRRPDGVDYTDILGRRLSRLALGTVQLGMVYGINNRTGQPSGGEVTRIFDAAFEGGITVLDTAYAYGNSEQVLGTTLAELRPPEELTIVTKLKPLPAEEMTLEDLRAEVEESLETSLRRLRQDRIPIYLLHRAEHLTAREGAIVDHLLRLRDQDRIGHLGASIYTPEQAETALAMEGIEAIQVPFNLFDPRLLRSGFFERARDRGVAVFVRSVFLQGLIPMAPENVPEALGDVLPFKRILDEFCERDGRSAAELALQFVLAQTRGSSLVVGVERSSQVRENLRLFEAPPLPDALVEEIPRRLNGLPEHILNPSFWKELLSR